MTDLLHDRLTALRTAEDDPDWHDVLRRTSRRRTRRLSAQGALFVLCAALMATPALGLGRVLDGGQDDAATTPPMWLGLRADGTFCIALARQPCDDVDRERRLVFKVVDAETPLLRGYANAPQGATLELVSADGRSTPVPMRWLEAPGAVHLFAEPLAAVARPARLVLRGRDGRLLAREDLPQLAD